jgi:hypothetical protein
MGRFTHRGQQAANSIRLTPVNDSALSADTLHMPHVPNHPVSLKSLSVDAKGKLAHRRAVGPLGFAFVVAERSYNCRFYERSGQGGLTLCSTLGPMPKGDTRRTQRKSIRRIIQQARKLNIAFIIRRDGQIDLEYKLRLQVPVTGTDLLSHLTMAVIILTPWCKMIKNHFDAEI